MFHLYGRMSVKKAS
ncbi:hypothetical protein MTR67_029746 [Solanum verrucosum]|uniref:Uncharacterized protein n=1 Tax=Solanum verrucosum TaxID=315347 RepID=A0AAF0R6H2_SOLVR|nr:hypothetical protein MTR67_029746 [Solanum verrucosum]